MKVNWLVPNLLRDEFKGGGLILNILIRLSILYFLGEVLLFPDDLRFAEKIVPMRNI